MQALSHTDVDILSPPLLLWTHDCSLRRYACMPFFFSFLFFFDILLQTIVVPQITHIWGHITASAHWWEFFRVWVKLVLKVSYQQNDRSSGFSGPFERISIQFSYTPVRVICELLMSDCSCSVGLHSFSRQRQLIAAVRIEYGRHIYRSSHSLSPELLAPWHVSKHIPDYQSMFHRRHGAQPCPIFFYNIYT